MMEATGYLNGGDARLEEVISDLDRAHRVTLSGIYELPFFRRSRGFLKQAAGDWQLQAVWQRSTGAPLGLGNVLLLDDIRKLPAANQTLEQWFNTAIFNRNPAEQLGANVRTVSSRFGGVRVPGVESWDLSAVKNWRVREGWRLQLRGEFLNALNRSNFAGPVNDPTNAQLFGRINATTGFPRYVHLGLKLMY
jgi:hypothetical protein